MDCFNFNAIDFETANSNPASVCSLGIVEVRKGKLERVHKWLICPLDIAFSPANVKKHGISLEMVRNEPTFSELWGTIAPYFEGQVIVAHNASFDINVLRHVTDENKISLPNFKGLCSFKLAKKAWPNLANYKLPTIAKHLKLELNHHEAHSDALASANILLAACKELMIESLDKCFECFSVDSSHREMDIDRDFWDERGFEIHSEQDQVKRQVSAKKLNVVSIDYERRSGIINDYSVTLFSCQCRDFTLRHKPCKHMYRLAHELKIFSLGSYVQNLLPKDAVLKKIYSLREEVQKGLVEVLYSFIYRSEEKQIYDANHEIVKEMLREQIIEPIIDYEFALGKLYKVNELRLALTGLGVNVKKTARKQELISIIATSHIEKAQEMLNNFAIVTLNPDIIQHKNTIYRNLLKRLPKDIEDEDFDTSDLAFWE